MPLGAPKLEDMPQCMDSTCPIRMHCEVPKGLAGKGIMQFNFTTRSCDWFYPVADLRGECLRNNTSNQPVQDRWDPMTKRVKRRRVL